ncbi:MAG: hypothetical protein KJP17_05195 [Gammaproteobacteria bacterium]|nr:hypothetical protein [Gammaproteobacteria bacterium]
MDYQGLTPDDLANVRALNAAWLDLAPEDAGRNGRLTRQRRQRLAGTPFLLFTLREGDDRLWARLLDDRRQPDLLARRPDPGDPRMALQSTSLAFLWELSRRNPYVARVVGFAPLNWCERIASMTLMQLQASVAGELLLGPRFASGSPQYLRLLQRGGSALREARRFAQIAAMQSLLTQGDIAQYGRLAAAACRMAGPARQVAEEV